MNTSPHIANALLLLAVSATYLADARPPRSLGAVRIDCRRRPRRERAAARPFDVAVPACVGDRAFRASQRR